MYILGQTIFKYIDVLMLPGEGTFPGTALAATHTTLLVFLFCSSLFSHGWALCRFLGKDSSSFKPSTDISVV